VYQQHVARSVLERVKRLVQFLIRGDFLARPAENLVESVHLEETNATDSKTKGVRIMGLQTYLRSAGGGLPAALRL
jgi:hypothetical protein